MPRGKGNCISGQRHFSYIFIVIFVSLTAYGPPRQRIRGRQAHGPAAAKNRKNSEENDAAAVVHGFWAADSFVAAHQIPNPDKNREEKSIKIWDLEKRFFIPCFAGLFFYIHFSLQRSTVRDCRWIEISNKNKGKQLLSRSSVETRPIPLFYIISFVIWDWPVYARAVYFFSSFSMCARSFQADPIVNIIERSIQGSACSENIPGVGHQLPNFFYIFLPVG